MNWTVAEEKKGLGVCETAKDSHEGELGPGLSEKIVGKRNNSQVKKHVREEDKG